MSTEIAKEVDLLIPQALVVKPKFGDDATHERMSGSGFLPRVHLMTSTNRLVQTGKTKMGNYCLVKGKDALTKDFGPAFNCLVITWRPKAMDFSGQKAKAFYNPTKQGFKDVEVQADKRVKKFMYGPEYLVYIPELDTLASFHFNNITMRMRAGEMKALLGKAGTFRSEVIEGNGNLWPGPVISLCSTPLSLPEDRETFLKRIQDEAVKFANPPDEEVENVDDTPETAGATDDNARPR
jgi:hypothetical protein